MIILFFSWMCVFNAVRSIRHLFQFCLRTFFLKFFVFLLLLFTSFVCFVHEAVTEIIQLNRHLRHWFSASISLDIRIEYMLFSVFHWVRSFFRYVTSDDATDRALYYCCWEWDNEEDAVSVAAVDDGTDDDDNK